MTAQARTIASVDKPTPLSYFKGRTVWSAFDASTKTYRLMTAVGGTVAAVPVAPREAPFDVDLGPGPDGHVVAAYSRCARETDPPVTSAGCDLYAYDFTAGRERRLPGASTSQASETNPSIWKDTVAFQRRYERRPGRRDGYDLSGLSYLYTRPLAGGRSERQPGGQRGGNGGLATSLDLYGDNLSFAWSYSRDGGAAQFSTLRIDRVGSRRHRFIEGRLSGLVGRRLITPTGSRGRITYGRISTGDQIRFQLVRYRISTGRRTARTLKTGRGELFTPISIARDDATTGYSTAVGQGPSSGCSFPPPYCEIRLIP